MPRIRKERLQFEPPVAVYGQPGVIWSKESQEWTWDAEQLARIAIEKAAFEKIEDDKETKREYERQKKNRQNERKAEEKVQLQTFGFTWNDPDIPKEEEARKLIQADGIEHPGVIKMLLRNLHVAAEEARLVPNRFAYRYGLRIADIERRKAQGLPDSPFTLKPSDDFDPKDENLYLRQEIDRIWGDYSAWIGFYAGKPQAEWLQARVSFKYDLFYAGSEIFGIAADENLHREMCDFYGDRTPARDLPRLYTQKDIQEVYRRFGGPEKIQKRLMMIFRGAGKSTWNSVHACRAICCIPDVRLLLLSSTKGLTRDLLDLARNKFIVDDLTQPSKFQALYPEHCLRPGKDSTNFASPLRRLALREKTIAMSSAEAANSGRHCDEALLDDYIGDGSSDKVPTQEKAIKRYDLALSLLDNWGQEIALGTPYEPGDLYDAILARNAARNGNLLFLKGPVWEILPEFQNTPTAELEPHMVIMRDRSGRIDFAKIKEFAVDAPVNFSRQYLCEPAYSTGADHQIFTRDEFVRGMVHESSVPSNAESFACWDTSYGHESGDFSCGLDLLRWRDAEGWMHLAVRNCIMKKLKPADLAVEIVDMYRNAGMRFRAVGIETPSNRDQLDEKIREACRVRLPYGLIPLQWISVDYTLNAKSNRIKDLQLLSGGQPIQLHWIHGCANLDLLWDQFENFRPNKKSGKSDERRDDGPDTLAKAAKWLIQSVIHPEQPAQNKTHQEQQTEFLENWKNGEEARNRDFRELMHSIRFPAYDTRLAPANDAPGNRYSPNAIADGYRKRIGGK
jgi:hypothetical protein